MKVEMGEAQPAFYNTIRASVWPLTSRRDSPDRDLDDMAGESDKQAHSTYGARDNCLEEIVNAQPTVSVILSAGCRPLRRQLPAVAWMILEQVALDTVVYEGRALARTSARQIADELAVNPGTVARGLRLLRDKGLVVLQRDPGPVGRFGRSVYVLNSVDGLTVNRPDTDISRTAHPSIDPPHVKDPSMVSPSTATPRVDKHHVVHPPPNRRRPQAEHHPPPLPTPPRSAQAALDLGLGS